MRDLPKLLSGLLLFCSMTILPNMAMADTNSALCSTARQGLDAISSIRNNQNYPNWPSSYKSTIDYLFYYWTGVVASCSGSSVPFSFSNFPPVGGVTQGSRYNIGWSGKDSGVTSYVVTLARDNPTGNIAANDREYIGTATVLAGASSSEFSWSVKSDLIFAGSGWHIEFANGSITHKTASFTILPPPNPLAPKTFTWTPANPPDSSMIGLYVTPAFSSNGSLNRFDIEKQNDDGSASMIGNSASNPIQIFKPTSKTLYNVRVSATEDKNFNFTSAGDWASVTFVPDVTPLLDLSGFSFINPAGATASRSGLSLVQGQMFNATWSGADFSGAGGYLTNYQVYLDSCPTMLCAETLLGSASASASKPGGSFSFSVPLNQTPGQDYMLVFRNNDFSVSHTSAKFSISASAAAGSVTLNPVILNSSTGFPVVSWKINDSLAKSTVGGAWQVNIAPANADLNGGYTMVATGNNSHVAITDLTSYTFTADNFIKNVTSLPAGDYHARVLISDAKGNGTYSNIVAFKLSKAVPFAITTSGGASTKSQTWQKTSDYWGPDYCSYIGVCAAVNNQDLTGQDCSDEILGTVVKTGYDIGHNFKCAAFTPTALPSINKFIVPLTVPATGPITIQYGATGSNLSSYTWRLIAVCPVGVSVYDNEGSYCSSDDTAFNIRPTLGPLVSSAQTLTLQVKNTTSVSQQVKFRLSVTSGSGSAETESSYLANTMVVSAQANPSITNFSLGSNSSWTVGSQHTFTWSLSGIPSDASLLVAYFDANSQASASNNTKIATLGPTATSYTWTLPSSLAAGHSYAMRVSIISSNGSDVADTETSGQLRTDRTFTVIVPAVTTNIQLTSPTEASTISLAPGATTQVSFKAFDYGGSNFFVRSWIGQSETPPVGLAPVGFVGTSGGTFTVSPAPTTPGSYQLYVELLNSDQSPYNPRIYKKVYVTVTAPTATNSFPNNDDTNNGSGYCNGRNGWWWNGQGNGTFANGDSRILCYNDPTDKANIRSDGSGYFYSPTSDWGGQAYKVNVCVQKGGYYSTASGWVSGTKPASCIATSMSSYSYGQLAALLSYLEKILTGMKADISH